MPLKSDEETIAWRLGGPQGKGIDKVATLFARACACDGLEVIGRREYHSNIMGRHSYVDVTLGGAPLHCHREHPDLLVTFEPEALCRHLASLAPSGHLLCSGDDGEVDLGKLDYLDERLRAHLEKLLEARDLPPTTSGMLEMARQGGIRVHAIPYRQLLDQLAEQLGERRPRVQAAVNTLAITVSAVLVGIPL